MVEIFIDGIAADTGPDTVVSVTLALAELTELEYTSTGYSKTVVIPSTPRNDRLFEWAAELNADPSFTLTDHTARITNEGCVVMEGMVALRSSSLYGKTNGCYEFAVIGPGKKWANKLAGTELGGIGINFSCLLTASNIQQSWTWSYPVRFFPVKRSRPLDATAAPYTVEVTLSETDYHPFIHLRTVVERMFTSAGYTVESDFFATDLFRSLYFSGVYPKTDTDASGKEMDFMAGRYEAVSAAADADGQVYANPLIQKNSIGNIVQTADPAQMNPSAGNAVFNSGGCFRYLGERIAFVPSETVTVGFEYYICYRTAHYIIDRDTLRGFDKICLGDGIEHKVILKNTFPDHRNSLRSQKRYTVIVFNHTSGDSYYLEYRDITNVNADPLNLGASDAVIRSTSVFSTRTAAVTLSGTYGVADPVLWHRRSGTQTYVMITKDWALYDATVAETGYTDVEVSLRSIPEQVSPSSPKYFNRIYFTGGASGDTLTIGQATSLRPYFHTYPIAGTSMNFKQMADIGCNCLELLNSVKHMFNLRFYTNETEKKVRIEPCDDFYNGETVDWCGKLDLAYPVVIEEPGREQGNICLSYREGGTDVRQWNGDNEDELGTWISMASGPVGKTLTNPVFSPALNGSGLIDSAYYASVPIAQETDRNGEPNLNFSPVVVQYAGTMPLPRSDTWGWPSYGNRFPLCAFHYPGEKNIWINYEPDPEEDQTWGYNMFVEGSSLCFEDRDNQSGLSRYYASQVEILEKGKRVTAYLWLGPQDIERLTSPNTSGAGLCARYRLGINGETALFRLEKVIDYNASSPGPTKCIFIKIV